MSAGIASPPNPGLINGPVYKTAHFSTAYLNVPPNMHRLRNAVGLMIGLYAGRQLMDVVAGETLDGKKIDLKDVPIPLKPLHRLMPYDHFSDNPNDRWHKVFDMVVPGVLGAMGAAAGSVSFYQASFMKPVMDAMKHPAGKFSIAAAEDRSLYYLSSPEAAKSAVASTLGSAGGQGFIAGPGNYSATLGTTFTMRARRQPVLPFLSMFDGIAQKIGLIKPEHTLQEALFNGHGSLEPFRPHEVLKKAADQLAGNPAVNPQNFERNLRGAVKMWYRKATPEQVNQIKDILLAERQTFLNGRGATLENLTSVEADLSKHLKDYLSADNTQLEKLLIKVGIDPREIRLGDMGVLSDIARWTGDAIGFGTTKKLEKTRDLLIKGMEERNPELLSRSFTREAIGSPHSKTHLALAGGYFAAGAGSLYAISTSKDAEMKDLDTAQSKNSSAQPVNLTLKMPPTASAGTEQKTSFEEKIGPKKKHIIHSKTHKGFVNDEVLDTAEGVTSLLNASIGSHRVHCAAGLTVGSMIGDKLMEALTGISFKGEQVPVDKVWKPFQKFYKALQLNPHSDAMADKWMQILRWAVPGVLGAAAVVHGSNMFFDDRYKKQKKAKFLDEVEDKGTMAQSEPWSYISSVSSLMGFPTGAPILPFVNYSTSLGTRFSMASGRKVALPIVGKWWSNNDTLFPYGPSGMLDLVIKEAVNNKSYDPELLETYTIGALKPWYEKVTPQQIEAFVLKVHEVRDRFFREGGVPEDMKAALEKELTAAFHGAGLWDRLEEIGLNPLEAKIANNGMAGTIANTLGAKKHVDEIKAEHDKNFLAYKSEKYVDRVKGAAPDTIPIEYAQKLRQQQDSGLHASSARSA